MNVADLRPECARFTGYRPCEHDCRCKDCPHFEPAGPSVLILKLYQLGNIVKTTPILHALRKLHPGCRVTWMASGAGGALLANNPFIEQVIGDGAADVAYVQQRRWDLVLSLESNQRVAAIAESAPAEQRLGIGLHPDGKLWPLSPESEALYVLSISDEARFRENQRTVHEMYFDLLGVPYEGEEYVICPSEADFARADELVGALDLGEGPVVGLNTGGNMARFANKHWTVEGFIELAAMLRDRAGAKVVLLGGPMEVERNRAIRESVGEGVVDSGCDHSILEFCAFLSRLTCVVSGDSFGLQASVAMRTPVVGLFGPTPPQEIAMFGRGRRVVVDLDCAPCYTRSSEECHRGADCMRLITPDEVYAATVELLP